MKCVRLWYKKSGLAVFTSHLDMNRCFTRAVRRADIPLWYTEGFNPHPYMTFLLPLPLGTAGEREPIDIRLTDDVSNDEIKARLNAALPDGLSITDVAEPKDKADKIASALYEISLEFAGEEEAEAFAKKADEIVSSGELNAEKKSKKGIKTVNLCEMILRFEAAANEKTVGISAVLASGNSSNLAAALLIDSLEKKSEIEIQKTRITRKEIYKENFEPFE